MTLHLFPGVFVQEPDADPAPLTAFTVWTDSASGTDITSLLTAADGITPYDPVTDDQGNILPFCGPDDFDGPAFVDTGASIRYMLLSSTRWTQALADIDTALANVDEGGGLPVGTTLTDIPDGVDRFALSAANVVKLNGIAAGATNLQIGTGANQAKRGDYVPTAAEVGAVRTMTPNQRLWFRTAAQGQPTAGDGAVNDTDWLIMDNG
jgi:hypothetical protein